MFLKEKGIKPGQFISARVVKVHKRPNGTVSNLDLVTSDLKSVVRRDVRQVYLLEHDYHKLVNPGFECLLEDSATKNRVLMTTLHSQLTETEVQNPRAAGPLKRGVEGCFSTKTYTN